MKLVFFGYGELGAVGVDSLVEPHVVALVLTHRTEFTGLGEPHVAELVEKHGLPVHISSNAREPEIRQLLRDADADAIVSTNWRTRLPGDLLGMAKLGALNVHDALLPSYSGFGAVNWAIRNGETEAGVTVHLMEEELDTGPAVVQHRVPIGPHDTALQVYEAVTAQYVPATLAALEKLAAGDRGTPQDPTRRTFYHRIGEDDTMIDWSQSTARIYNLIRGQSDPYINAWTTFDGRKVAVKSAALPDGGYCGTPGKVVRQAQGGVAVVCGQTGSPDALGIILLEVQVEGDEPRPATEVFKKMGVRLGS
ncbi:methionyl-tRNA formyltransferase [Saccharothrix deserti]|uniref:methionyl-tRNA formyltransferase n=1 Tax=Saccharothrix deserti TaxID=2593674 RepID=UPI00131B2A04|nr:methionyl-tRNA formyltransferase [Saccharothrix deserti]